MAVSPDYSTTNPNLVYRISVTEDSFSVPNNTSTVTTKVEATLSANVASMTFSGFCSATIDGTRVRAVVSGKTISFGSYTTLLTNTSTIKHNLDGTKTIYVSAYLNLGKISSNANGFNYVLTNIPTQAHILTAQDFTDIENPTITYENLAGAGATTLQACISLSGLQDDVPYRDIDKEGNSYTFTLTSGERNTLRQASPNSNTLTVFFYIKSVINGQTYYSYKSQTMTIVNANPDYTNVSYSDDNLTTVGVTGDDQIIIQNQSDLHFAILGIRSYKGATLSSVSVTIEGVTHTDTLSGTSVNYAFAYGLVDFAEDTTAQIVITDSRGNTATASVPITIWEWKMPTGNILLRRVSNYYSETDIKVDATYSSLNSHNTITILYYYREKGVDTWTGPAPLSDGVQIQRTFDNTKDWEFKFEVQDAFGTSTYNLTLPLGMPILFIDRLRRSVGIGAIPDQNNMLVADRRISLKNPDHETVMDLWSASSGSFHTALMRIYDENGTVLNQQTATANGGQSVMKNVNGDKTCEMITGGGNDGTVNVYDNAGQWTINLSGAGGEVNCTVVHQSSSRKIKKNIVEMALDEARKILKLTAVTFDYKNERRGKNKRGFIAEDVAEVIPELVKPESCDYPAALDYIGMISYLQTIIKDHEERIKALEDKLNNGGASCK